MLARATFKRDHFKILFLKMTSKKKGHPIKGKRQHKTDIPFKSDTPEYWEAYERLVRRPKYLRRKAKEKEATEKEGAE